MRKLKTLGIIIGLYLVVILLSALLYFVNPGISDASVEGFGIIIFLILIGTLAKKVGYRWFDCFFIFIPFYGLFWLFRIAYRIAYLPNTDWDIKLKVESI